METLAYYSVGVSFAIGLTGQLYYKMYQWKVYAGLWAINAFFYWLMIRVFQWYGLIVYGTAIALAVSIIMIVMAITFYPKEFKAGMQFQKEILINLFK